MENQEISFVAGVDDVCRDIKVNYKGVDISDCVTTIVVDKNQLMRKIAKQELEVKE